MIILLIILGIILFLWLLPKIAKDEEAAQYVFLFIFLAVIWGLKRLFS